MDARSHCRFSSRRVPPALLVLLACSVMVVAQALPYRLLSSRRSGDAGEVIESDYNISVDRYLDVTATRDVICRLMRTENPKGYDVLSVGIYYMLDRYIPESERDLKDSVQQREHRIAQYHWSKDSPKDSRRLVFNRDPKGQPLAEWRFNNFNHSKDCS